MVDVPPPVREVMHSGVLTVGPEESLVKAAETMEANDVGGLVVVDHDNIEGILTRRDVMTTLAQREGDVGQAAVREAMTQPVVTIPPFVDAEDALRAMSHHGLDHLPVAWEGRLVGMLTEGDILDRNPDLAPVAHSLRGRPTPGGSRQVRVAGRCRDCETASHDLREVDGGYYCYRCSGGLPSRDSTTSTAEPF